MGRSIIACVCDDDEVADAVDGRVYIDRRYIVHSDVPNFVEPHLAVPDSFAEFDVVPRLVVIHDSVVANPGPMPGHLHGHQAHPPPHTPPRPPIESGSSQTTFTCAGSVGVGEVGGKDLGAQGPVSSVAW